MDKTYSGDNLTALTVANYTMRLIIPQFIEKKLI